MVWRCSSHADSLVLVWWGLAVNSKRGLPDPGPALRHLEPTRGFRYTPPLACLSSLAATDLTEVLTVSL